MPALLTTRANEKGTYVITAAFTDEDGSSVTPDSITWTLTDTDGTVINDRLDVNVDTPAASINIVLSGLDLAIQSGEAEESITVGAATYTVVERILTIEAVYDSDYGNNLPLKSSVKFQVENMVAIS